MSTDLDVHPTLVMPSIMDRTVRNPPLGRTVVMIGNHHCRPEKDSITTTPAATNLELAAAVVHTKKDAVKNEVLASASAEDEENPITPTLEENKIPAPKSPPPAPRKRRCGAVIACRKKLDFLEQQPQLIIPKDDEIQEFFASSFEQIQSRRLLKRRCPCV